MMKRTALVAAITVAGVAGQSQPTHAGPLCDWLFGRHTAPVAPYAAGYPYAASYPYAAAYPYAAGHPVAAAPAYAAAYPVPVSPAPASTASASGTAALQMPSYTAGYGAIPAQGPTDQGYATFSPPPGTTFPVTPAPTTSFYGTGNVYPSDYGSQGAYQAGYGQAGYGSVAPVTAYQPPVTTNPSTVQTYPGTPAANPGLLGGMSRFFGNVFGTGYQSSYYRAPVTYYRPVTTLSPATGQPTIVQQPCTSYEQQLQRSPVTSFAPSTAPTAIAPAPCAPTTNYYNPYAGGGVAPATAIQTTPENPYTPSTNSGQYYGPPATSSGGESSPDRIEIGQPQLESSARPEVTPDGTPPTTPPPTSWWTQSAMRSGEVESRVLEKKNQLTAPSLQAESSNLPQANTAGRTDLRPLPAGEYPYSRQSHSPSQESPENSGPTTRPSRPPAAEDARDRVASANGLASRDWGYKPIQWTIRQANYEPTSTARTSENQLEEPADYAPPVNRPRAGTSSEPTTSAATTLRTTGGSVQPQQLRMSGTSAEPHQPAANQAPAAAKPSYGEYQSSGWTSKPRR